MTNLDPRIGVLNSGKHYAFVNGYDQPEVVGTLAEVEAALGLRAPTKAHTAPKAPNARTTAAMRSFTATLTDPEGCAYRYTVDAYTKAKARKKIADIYRENTPPKSAGFYTFAQQRLAWVEEP